MKVERQSTLPTSNVVETPPAPAPTPTKTRAWDEDAVFLEETARAPQRVALTRALIEGHGLHERCPREAKILLWASGTGRDEADTQGLVPPAHAQRALAIVESLASPDRAFVTDLLDRCTNDAARAIVLKGLNARFPIESPDAWRRDLERLTDLVHDKPLDWLVEHTTPHGLATRTGVTQSFTTSCGPATTLAVRAEFDPLVALDLALDAQRGHALLSLSAALERELMEATGAEAIPRDLLARLQSGTLFGAGTPSALARYVQQPFERVGLAAVPVVLGQLDRTTQRQHLDTMRALLTRGIPIPLEARRGDDYHYCELVDVRTRQGQRAWRLHDVDDGRTRWVTDDELIRASALRRGYGVHAAWLAVAPTADPARSRPANSLVRAPDST